MACLVLNEPLQFKPLFMERVWGGRRLEERYGKKLPNEVNVGESWEIADRPEAQSIVLHGPLGGKTLHELWRNYRSEIFGTVADSERFPLLIKLLDAEEKLSLQVHPSPASAAELGGEAKTEFWYIAHATAGAELYAGLRNDSSRARFVQELRTGDVASLVHRIAVKTGDALLLPSGRLHSIGAGNLVVEVQQNSDTTYRVFDWDRIAANGKRRELHIDEALRCIDFEDYEPQLLRPKGELLVRDRFFEVQRWEVTEQREIAHLGQFAILFCLEGEIVSAKTRIIAGKFALIPAGMADRQIQPGRDFAKILRLTIPD